MSISKSDFTSFLEERNGAYFLTKTRKEYQVQIKDGDICFTPQSTGEERILSDREIEKGIVHFNKTGSLMPKYYRDYGVNASYYLPIFDQVRDSGREPSPSEGIDVPDVEVPERVKTRTTRIIRDTALAEQVKEEYDYTCQICGTKIDLVGDKAYAEAHHVHPLGENGPDVKENIMCVCPNHHAMLDYKVLRLNADRISGIARKYVQRHNAQVMEANKKAV